MYDLAIIGAGAAGIACAKKAKKYQLKTVLIEENSNCFGGTCLNRGCIPAKFFINSSKQNKDWHSISIEKNKVIERIKNPLIKYLLDNKIEIVWSQAQFLDKHTLSANGQKIEARNIIIATGSSPKKIIEDKKAIFADDFFSKDSLPQKILIIGAGYIGVEFACLLNRLGKSVCLVEKEERILPLSDSGLSRRLQPILERKGIKIITGKNGTSVNYSEFDLVISALGRTPNVSTLNPKAVGLALDENGWIKTDQFMRTNLKNIYACGDITGKKLLAYIAEYQAELAVKNIIGKKVEEDYLGVAECVFSLPQVASVGILEDEAKKKNIKYRTIRSNFLRFSSPYVYDDTEGFIEVFLDRKDKIIGAKIISNSAAELISIFSLAIRNNLKLKNLKNCIFIHPTLCEIIPLLLKENSSKND